jgi:hypothetical protein
LIVFLLFHIPINSFIILLVHLVIWWHFMLLVVRTLTSWSIVQGRPLYLNIVYDLCLFFSQVLYIHTRTSSMILMIWFWIRCTRFLRPPLKGDNGWLNVAIIALLTIAWFITLKTPFWH